MELAVFKYHRSLHMRQTNLEYDQEITSTEYCRMIWFSAESILLVIATLREEGLLISGRSGLTVQTCDGYNVC